MRFILVDRILELAPGRSIKAVKVLGPEEELFRDHFPGFPVVPGVLLTGMMAQAAGKCLDSGNPERGKAMLARISSASFRGWVQPGQTAEITAEVRASRPQFATADCWIEVEGKKVCSAELFFSFMAMKEFAAGYRDEVLEEYLARRRDAGP